MTLTPSSYSPNNLTYKNYISSLGILEIKTYKGDIMQSGIHNKTYFFLRSLATAFMLIQCCIAFSQPAFRTATLHALANAIPLNDSQTTDGYHYETVNGHKYVYHVSSGTIDHVGISLFKDEIKSIAKTPILDFLERYFLQLKYPGEKNVGYMLRSDRFRFSKGNMQTISQLNDSDAFSFKYEMGLYHASWKRDNKEILSVTFPKDYQLISGENKIEAEKLLENDINNTLVDESKQLPAIERQLLIESQQKGYYTLPGNNYQIAKITNNLYFSGDSIKGYNLICDISHPLESAANIMLSPYTHGEFSLEINQALYGYQRKHFYVPLKKWIGFCLDNDCQLYFGIEEQDNKRIKASIFSVNDALGYAHVLVAEIPLQAIDNDKGTIDARLDSYIPINNIRNMFAKYHKNKRITPRLYEK